MSQRRPKYHIEPSELWGEEFSPETGRFQSVKKYPCQCHIKPRVACSKTYVKRAASQNQDLSTESAKHLERVFFEETP